MAVSEVTWPNLRLCLPVTFLKGALAAVFMSVWTRGGRLGGLMIYQSVYISMVPKPIRGVPAQTRVFHSALPHHYWINQCHWGWIYLWGRKWEVIWYTWPGALFTAAANKCGGGCRSLPVWFCGSGEDRPHCWQVNLILRRVPCQEHGMNPGGLEQEKTYRNVFGVFFFPAWNFLCLPHFILPWEAV